MRRFTLLFVALFLASATRAQPVSTPDAVNQLGIDLLRTPALASPSKNQLISPYSLEVSLAMAYVGAEGQTRAEMGSVLHLPADPAAVAAGFSALAQSFAAFRLQNGSTPENGNGGNGAAAAIELNVANAFFAQTGFAFRPSFVGVVTGQFGGTLDAIDFKRSADAAEKINAWVAKETQGRIPEIVSADALDPKETRAVLANAVYLRAPWDDAFENEETKPRQFWIAGRTRIDVPTMHKQFTCGYERRRGYSAVSIRYLGGQLQFVVLLPDRRDGLEELERALTADSVRKCASLPAELVSLSLPKFTLDLPGINVRPALFALGMHTAFDVPRRSANFNGIAAPTPDGYITISDVFHRTWLALDENGTEAAAATGTVVRLTPLGISREPPRPIEVRVDHPFLFFVQHVPSGTCLFIGHVVDPR